MTTKTRRRGPPSKKVTISLPDDLFRELERVRRIQKQDRSGWVQHVVSEAIARERKAEKDRAYVESYRNDPETPEEIAEAMALAIAAFRADPWE
jgi:metal-responsive CopG/Arc/MetJ family transcriptional regulator